MKRYKSRKISRNRKLTEALNPCQRYTTNGGIHPFRDLLNKLSLKLQIDGRSREQAEKHALHQLKMASDQKSAKARQQRKRNKV